MNELEDFFDFSNPNPIQRETVSTGTTSGRIKVEPGDFSEPGVVQARNNLDRSIDYARQHENELNRDLKKVNQKSFFIKGSNYLSYIHSSHLFTEIR